MHWTSSSQDSNRASLAVAERTSRRSSLRIFFLVFLCTLLVSGAPEKHLSVYSTAANYSVPLVQREGHDYVGLLELLEPLGRVTAKADNSRWRLRYNNVQAEFEVNKTRARIQGRDADLGGKFLIENKRGLVPVGSLSALLPRILGGPVSLHEVSGRLFIGNVATHFTASLSGDNPPKLVFHFTAPVNPTIATDAGVLRMTFSREPLVGPASPTLTFGSKVISSATYGETNGVAVVTVNAAIPVIASFANEGRTGHLAHFDARAERDTRRRNQSSAHPPPAPASRSLPPRHLQPAVTSRSSMPATVGTITGKP